jgi:hypothetical protein
MYFKLNKPLKEGKTMSEVAGKGLLGGLFGGHSSILFFFLLLVIIFCNCRLFTSGDSLLFFFLLLIVLFGGRHFFAY